MSRAVSIHIGVNQPPQGRYADTPLRDSESTAWRMAELAGQAGYHRMLVLRGPAATRYAVHEALASAAGLLERHDTLFVSFSGHGGQETDRDLDERHGSDESWCLYDGELLDDKLAGYWRLFDPGVRIVAVSESCFSGGVGRIDAGSGAYAAAARAPGVPRVMRGGSSSSRGPEPDPARISNPIASCIGEPPRDCCEIRASVLLLTASAEQQPAQDGLFARSLLDVWGAGAFRGSYCDLYQRVRERVMAEAPSQEPQIQMLGSPDPGFPLLTAFHVDGGGSRRLGVYRGRPGEPRSRDERGLRG
jgi:metacaspase-1